MKESLCTLEPWIYVLYTIACWLPAWTKANRSIGGIIIPDSAKEKPQQAEVKAVGNGKLLDYGERVAPSR